MGKEDDRREELSRLYEELSPDERRRRIVLEPAYRSAYNELLDIEDRMSVPRYFWRKWLPVLGPVPASLYIVLRDMSRVDAKTSEAWCWPDQTELGRMVGVKDQKTVRKHLRLLEEHGFIAQEASYYHREDWGKRRGTNRYLVFLDIPLTQEDAVELLLREASRSVQAEEHHDGKFSRYGAEAVDNSPMTGNFPGMYDGKNSLAKAREKSPSNVNVPTSNVLNNVIRRASKKSAFRNHPVVRAMSEAEQAEKEALAYQISDQLKIMSGDRTSDAHKSLGLIRRICYLMPEQLVREAIISTRDAIEEQRSGRKSLREGPGGYFAGIVRAIEEREGLDLGVKWRGPRVETPPERPRKAPERPPERRNPVGESPGEEEFVPMPESAREALKALLGDKRT